MAIFLKLENLAATRNIIPEGDLRETKLQSYLCDDSTTGRIAE